MSERPWFLVDSGVGDAAFNMALDEALLGAMPRLGKPVVRFYGWSQPAASFGYFQKYAEMEKLTLLRPLVRRPTAGGLVPHDADWTYSLAFPNNHEWYSVSAIETYCRAHQWIQRAFAKMKIPMTLASSCLKAEAGQCFSGYEKFDLLWNGRKIAGAAQRRTREGLLIQGSVQPPPLPVTRADWQQAICKTTRLEDGVEWIALEPDRGMKERVADLVAHKYSREIYNRKR